jgi:hypothetical protein
MVAEIPDAAPYPQMGDRQAVDPTKGLYMLPRGAYTATLTGAGTGAYNAAVFAGNQMLWLADVPATAATQDTMAFYHEYDDPPTGGFVFSSPDASKPFTATIGERFEASGSTRLYTLKNCISVPASRAVFSVSPDFDSLRFTNRASTPMVCTVELKNTMASDSAGMDQTFPTARLPGVVVPGMTTAVFAPSDWLDLNHATINTNLLSCGDNACSAGESPKSCPEDCHPAACVTPADDLHLTSSAALCPGSYALPDAGSPGVISVDADNVTLDCSGARLLGGGSGTGILAAGRHNVTITGCAVQGYATGIDLQNAAGVQVQRSAVISNTVYGILAAGAQQVQIGQNYVATNQTGIDLSGAAGAQLSSNLVCINASQDILAASLTGGAGSSNRCQNVLGWNDQGLPACTYACSVSGPWRFYLPMVNKVGGP